MRKCYVHFCWQSTPQLLIFKSLTDYVSGKLVICVQKCTDSGGAAMTGQLSGLIPTWVKKLIF